MDLLKNIALRERTCTGNIRYQILRREAKYMNLDKLFTYFCIKMFNDLLYSFILLNKIYCSLWSNASYRFTVITAKQYTQIYKLKTEKI